MNAIECGESLSRVCKLEKKLEQLETWMRRNLGYVNLDGGFDNFLFPSPRSPVKPLNTIPAVIVKTEIISDHEDENLEEISVEPSAELEPVESHTTCSSVENSSKTRDAGEPNSLSAPNWQHVAYANETRVTNTHSQENAKNLTPSAPLAPVIETQPKCQPSVVWRSNQQSPFKHNQNARAPQFERPKTGALKEHNHQNQNQAVNSPVTMPVKNVAPLHASQANSSQNGAAPVLAPASQIHIQKSKGISHIMHPCKSCRKFFPSLQLLQKHVHWIHKKWKCKFCKKAFDQRISLEQHQKDRHSHSQRAGSYQKEKSLAYMTQRYKQQQQQQQQEQEQHEQTHTNPNSNSRAHYSLQPSFVGTGTGNKSQHQQPQSQSPGPYFQTTLQCAVSSTSTSTPCGTRGGIMIPVSTGSSISQQQPKGNGKVNHRTQFEIPNQISQPNVCPVCRKIFSIAEHLAQHMRSHQSRSHRPTPAPQPS